LFEIYAILNGMNVWEGLFMLQMLTTQLMKEFNKIKNDEWQQMEDVSRTLCNAIIGDGSIYWYGTQEMKALMAEIVDGKEPFPHSKLLGECAALSDLDRLVIATRFADDEGLVELIKGAQEQGAEVILLAAVKSEDDVLVHLCDFHIDTKITEALVPFEDGKIGFPSVMTMFFAYFCIYLTVKETLADFDGPLPTFE
jgi:hypothetical protein